MSDQLLAAAWEQVCTNLWAIRQSRAWMLESASWEAYCRKRWSLTKTQAKLYVNFAKFCTMCREAYLPVPESPDNVKPILALTHKRWLSTWKICLDYSDGPVNASHCDATMQQFSIISRKRIPAKVLESKRVQKAAEIMASFGDGERLVDQVGVNGLGTKWKDGVRVTIEADEAAMSERGSKDPF